MAKEYVEERDGGCYVARIPHLIRDSGLDRLRSRRQRFSLLHQFVKIVKLGQQFRPFPSVGIEGAREPGQEEYA